MTRDLQPANKSCHNCRRRRLRCDRSYPRCRKCSARGTDCLGYNQLLSWTGAVASRGKLAGKASSAPLCTAAPDLGCCRGISERSPASAERAPGLGLETPPSPAGAGIDVVLHVSRRAPPASPRGVAAPRALADPLFQDMNYSYRHYLSYFSERLCVDLVCCDLPGQNPFRSLLSMTGTYPLLQHVVVAASAAHMSNLMRMLPPAAVGGGTGGAVVSGSPGMSRRVFTDALVAKHKALQLLPQALNQLDTIGDVVLAAVVFLINVELLESGKHGWKAHLEGAGRIIALLQPVGPFDETLRDYILSDCLVYYILGSAFLPPMSESQLQFWSLRTASIVENTAANSYFCCPPEMLEIMHLASRLGYGGTDDTSPADDVTAAAAALMRRARDFDIAGWARQFHSLPPFRAIPVGSRVHAGSAHRAAACLYTLQAVPSVEASMPGGTADSLADELFHHLASVPDEDPNFKATTWPSFIAGAATRAPERRVWVMERLRRLASNCPWGFIYTAMETLPVVWGMNDGGERPKSWVQILRDPALNFLMV